MIFRYSDPGYDYKIWSENLRQRLDQDHSHSLGQVCAIMESSSSSEDSSNPGSPTSKPEPHIWTFGDIPKRGPDLAPPLNFPYNIAGVCGHWRDVIATIPEHWTKLTVFVDVVRPTPLPELERFVEYSKDQPLEVTVKRSDTSPSGVAGDVDEKQRIRAVIDILKPHFHRCTVIDFDVHYGSSLPSFASELCCLSKDLKILSLKCVEDDEHGTLEPSTFDHGQGIDFADTWPHLQSLCLSGYAIMDAAVNAVHLFANVQEQIELSTFFAKSNEPPITLISNLLHALSGETIQERNVELILRKIEIPFVPTPLDYQIRINTMLELYELGEDMLSNLLLHADLNEAEIIMIEDCTFNEDCNPLPSCTSLFLTNIQGCLRKPLSEWDGLELTLSDCEGFTDEVIRDLASRRRSGQCVFDRLALYRCWAFSSASILDLARSETPTNNLAGSTKMSAITVAGKGPAISKEGREDFERYAPGIIDWSAEGPCRSKKEREDLWDNCDCDAAAFRKRYGDYVVVSVAFA